MKYNTKVTVTVAVFNTEKYIIRCLDSLVAQTLKELEIIIVDDGSTDNSGKICDEYALKDDRIRVIHKENGGLGSARQVGLENAHGEYFIACDSDDWVEPTMYEDMYLKAKESDSDMVICDYCMNYPDGKEIKYHEDARINNRTDLLKAVLNHKICCNVWNKLVRRSFYIVHNIDWELGINQGEDALILYKKLIYPMNFSFIPAVFYHYWRDINSGSYTNNLSIASFKQMLFVNEWVHKNIDSIVFGRELYYTDISLAFSALRTKEMTTEIYDKYCRYRISFRKSIKYHIFGFKACLVYISNLNFSLAKKIMSKFYKFFYR